MKWFTVICTSEDLTGNDCHRMEVLAPDLESVYEIVNCEYPNWAIDQVFPTYSAASPTTNQ